MGGMLLSLLLLLACPKSVEPPPVHDDSSVVTITVLREGAGTQVVKPGSMVTVNYQLMVGGSVIDSTWERGIPFEFRMGAGQVISGWEEGVLGMKVGEKRSLIVPPSKGYGSRQTGPIPPDSTLFFEIELLAVKAPRVPPKGFQYHDSGEFHLTGTGLKYVDMSPCGEGVSPTAGAALVLDYSVFRPDHSLVESTLRSFDPVLVGYQTGQLPPGFEEGVATMTVGCSRQLWIPPELGGPLGDVPLPDTTVLIIEVDLLEVRPASSP